MMVRQEKGTTERLNRREICCIPAGEQSGGAKKILGISLKNLFTRTFHPYKKGLTPFIFYIDTCLK